VDNYIFSVYFIIYQLDFILGNPVPTTYEEMNALPTETDISEWDNGLVLLNRRPVGLDPIANYRLFGNNPGKSTCLIVIVVHVLKRF
jgi:hypothetical protein